MTGSSPVRPRIDWGGSPLRSISEILAVEERNSEARHKLLIETAKREHDRVREDAERIYRDHIQREEQQRLQEEKKKEEERIRRDEEIRAERIRVNALKAKKVEIPAPIPEPEPVKPPAPATAPTAPEVAAPPTQSAKGPASQPNGTTPQNLFAPKEQTKPQPPVSNPFAAKALPAAQNVAPAPQGPSNGVDPTPQPQTAPPARKPPPAAPTVDRFTEIHRNLKALRKSMDQQAKANPALKGRMGDMRREIRKCVGQLTGGTGGVNRKQQTTIVALLQEALANQVQSQPIDPDQYVVGSRNPVQGARNNEQLPSVFIYLLNIFSKAAIAQFINEGGARPETADPVGVCIAATFSEPDFHWRGRPLIDILMAKFRIVCPVLFGYKGSEKTQQGRERLGWWKDNGEWISEQQHMDRMTGLGAGFAAVSLRNFAKAKKENPYPPRNYWTAMAKIVNTPAEDISPTQCVVLRAMIENYEQKFLEFYGSAALAALRTALIEFPGKVPAKNRTSAVDALGVLPTMLKKEVGLAL